MRKRPFNWGCLVAAAFAAVPVLAIASIIRYRENQMQLDQRNQVLTRRQVSGDGTQFRPSGEGPKARFDDLKSEGRIGDVDVKVVGVHRLTDPPRVRIELDLSGATPNRKIDYHTWAPSDPNDEQAASLTDEFGNKSRLLDGLDAIAMIQPGKATREVLTFEAPIDNAEQLKLWLPGKAVGFEKQGLRLVVAIDSSE